MLSQSPRYRVLQDLADSPVKLQDVLTPERIQAYQLHQGSLRYRYATALVTDPIMDQLQGLADDQQVVRTFRELFGPNQLNQTEGRGATHIQLRHPSHRFWLPELESFIKAVRSGAYRSATGQVFTNIIQIGIGGSELGPRAAYHALIRWSQQSKINRLKGRFIANLDSDDGRYTLAKLDITKALFVVVSKSGGTLETQSNLAIVRRLAQEAGLSEAEFKSHLVVVTTQGSPLDSGQFGQSFYMDPGIGGRFSVTSAVGLLMLGLCFGSDIIRAFIDGAARMDAGSAAPNIRQNIPLLSALLGVWDRTFLGMPGRAVIPYCEGLRFLTAHLQQLECESCGKAVTVDGLPVDYATSPMVFGHTGTQAQHSFFQNLHQGSESIPVEFVLVKRPQYSDQTDRAGFVSSVVGQISALALGRHHDDPRKNCPGNRPSTLLTINDLTPGSLGELMAYYENRTVYQGLLWHINPFDQEGVELGKMLCQQVMNQADGFPTQLFQDIVQS